MDDLSLEALQAALVSVQESKVKVSLPAKSPLTRRYQQSLQTIPLGGILYIVRHSTEHSVC